MDKYKVIVAVLRFLYWILAVIVLYMMILKLTGHSPTTGDIALGLTFGLLATFFTFAIGISRRLSRIESDLKHLTNLVVAIGQDLKNHINDPNAHQRKAI